MVVTQYIKYLLAGRMGPVKLGSGFQNSVPSVSVIGERDASRGGEEVDIRLPSKQARQLVERYLNYVLMTAGKISLTIWSTTVKWI
jgi:hypothetical protein